MSERIQSVKGMHDLLPADVAYWQRLERCAADILGRYGYREMRIPVVEKTALFKRAIGETTDVVEKEMYTFEDRNGDYLSLRPEGTAGVVRAVLQHGLLYGPPLRLWYIGPMFRRERPQRGRLRQFHQIGAEVFGLPGPDIEAELLALCARLWSELGLSGIRLELNSLGLAEERGKYREALVDYLREHLDSLDADSRARLHKNPLRVLDSKHEGTQEIVAQAPRLSDYLGQESRRHFDALCGYLEALGIEYRVNPHLVRGLDYYSQTVFEWITDRLGAQGTVCAGGRYDGLIPIQGGKPWPGVGFAMGLERLVELMKSAGGQLEDAPAIYLVLVGDGTRQAGLQLAELLRERCPQLGVLMNACGGSFKAQFKRADRSGASLALVLGKAELAEGRLGVKFLREDRDQENIPIDAAAQWLGRWLAAQQQR